jgi:hypothetical protein
VKGYVRQTEGGEDGGGWRGMKKRKAEWKGRGEWKRVECVEERRKERERVKEGGSVCRGVEEKRKKRKVGDMRKSLEDVKIQRKEGYGVGG